MSTFFLFDTAFFIVQPRFPLKGKLKDVIIHFPYKIINDIKALDSQSRGPVFKTSGWLQGQLSLSSFLGR